MSRDEERKDLIRRALSSGGSGGFKSLVHRFKDPEERLELVRAGLAVAGGTDWQGKDLDVLAAIGRTGIDECLAQAGAARDESERIARTDAANVIAYNLAATLADCWPEDRLVHERRHFELGEKLGSDCLRWRAELKKGPFPFAIAHWVRGIHRLDLGDATGGTADMRAALEHAERHALAEGGAPVEPSRHFVVAISIGYLGIARHAGGDLEGRAQLEGAFEAFRVMARDEELRADAEFGVGQLQYVWTRFTAAP